jgi:hypothetical protein
MNNVHLSRYAGEVKTRSGEGEGHNAQEEPCVTPLTWRFAPSSPAKRER